MAARTTYIGMPDNKLVRVLKAIPYMVRLLFVAHTIHDQFGSLILIGFASVIGLQVLVNIGAISGLLPLTGMPLPFISYGGTALATALTMMGIANNISKYS